MRQRIVKAAVAAVTVAVVLFALPLAAVVKFALFTEERGELERAALTVAGRVGPQFSAGDQVELPPSEADKRIGVYGANGRLKAGVGPAAADPVTTRALAGMVADAQVGDELVVTVPVAVGENVVAVVRAGATTSVVWVWVWLAWLVLLALATAAVLAAAVVARRQARLLSEPLERLSDTARRVAEGDLTARAQPSTVPEIHGLAETQNAMLDRLAQLLDQERHFSADASHQLRTPLTGLQLGLENALEQAERRTVTDQRPVLLDSLARVRELDRTVADLLHFARATPDQALVTVARPLRHILDELDRRWHGPLAYQGRRLTIASEPEAKDISVPASVVTQTLDVLLDNAVQHGRGLVRVAVREIGDTLAVDVSDEGSIETEPEAIFARGHSTGPGHGIGLALARSMAQASGGRLHLAERSPTRFSLLLPHDLLPASPNAEATRQQPRQG